MLMDKWSPFLHGDGFDEWYELHVYRDSDECGGNVGCFSIIKHDHSDCSHDCCSCDTREREMEDTKAAYQTRRNLLRHNRHHLPDHRNTRQSLKNTTHRHDQRLLQNQEWQSHVHHQAQNQRHMERRHHSEKAWVFG